MRASNCHQIAAAEIVDNLNPVMRCWRALIPLDVVWGKGVVGCLHMGRLRSFETLRSTFATTPKGL